MIPMHDDDENSNDNITIVPGYQGISVSGYQDIRVYGYQGISQLDRVIGTIKKTTSRA